MVSITFPLEDKFFFAIERFPWVNWSELAREKLMMREIFDRYLKTGEVTDEDWEFCEQIDWHPVDWLPLKEEYIKKLESARKETPIRLKSAEDLFK